MCIFWFFCLFAACVFHTFIAQDYFRAAQTCIKFYEGTAGGAVTSYEGLYARLHHLQEAKQHIELVVAERRSPKGTALRASAALRKQSLGRSVSVEDPSHLSLSLSELSMHLRTITLQAEITDFMHRCAQDAGGVTSLRAEDDGKVPTLFGNSQVRGELAVQVSSVRCLCRTCLNNDVDNYYQYYYVISVSANEMFSQGEIPPLHLLLFINTNTHSFSSIDDQ